MTTYAQKDFSSVIGNTDQTIAQSGSLLTAIANLLSHFNFHIDPESLAGYLADMEVDPTQLTWGHVSLVHPQIGVFAINNGSPEYNDSIVVFNHNDRISYAAVADASAGTIIDSFDGLEKSWDVYGAPKMFVTFVKFQPLEVTPLTLNAPVSETPVSDTPTEESIVDDTTPEVTFDLSQEEPVDVKTGIFADPKELSETPDWKMTLKTGLGVIEGLAKKDAVIHDLDDEQPDIELKEGTIVPIAGRFIKDGVPYYRTTTSTNNDHWYGIPAGILGKSEKQQEDDFDHILADIMMEDEDEDLSGRERLIKSAATVEGKVLGFFKKDKKAKEIE